MNQYLDMSILHFGDHNLNKRVWIASRNIFKSSLKVGNRIKVSYETGSISIEADEHGSNMVSGRDENNPIIDLKNRSIREHLGDAEKIEVKFYSRRIVITVAKTESKKMERKAKTGNRFFELFAGGGTLHHFFKRAGFQSAGAVEMEERFLTVFGDNNPDTVTLCASIEDVDLDDYPDDINLLVCGIPCTTYSAGNVEMNKALKKHREGLNADPERLAQRFEAEALVFHILSVIRKMNVGQVVVEEVVQFASSGACMLLKTVLSSWGYHLSEAIVEGLHTKRKRWAMVADMNRQVNLEDLPTTDGKTIEDFLDGSVETREWQTVNDSKRFAKAQATVGLRSHKPGEQKINTVTTHRTRSTEPALAHPSLPLYSEFTNNEIARLHGLDGFKLPEGQKTLARQVLGQGVTDAFDEIARRVFASAQKPFVQPPKTSLSPVQGCLFG